MKAVLLALLASLRSGLPIAHRPPARGPRAAPPARRLPAVPYPAPHPHQGRRSIALGVAVQDLGWLAECLGVRPAEHRHRLAAPEVSRPLGSPLPRQARQTQAGQGGPGPHPRDVERQPTLGLPAHRRGARQAGHPRGQGDGRELHGRPKKTPSPTWRAFLANHVKDLVSVDFFVVPTVTFKVLFVFVVLAHARRRIVHFNVTEHPTAQWTAHQLSEAFPWEAAPRYLIRDRDRVYGPAFRTRAECMGIEEVLTAPRSPWQNPFVERVIGSVRRECLDQVIVLDERHLRRLSATTSSTTTAGVATARSPWTARSRDLCKGPSAGMSWRSRKPAASIATTSGTQPERVTQRDVLSPTHGAVTPWRGCLLSGVRAGLRPSASGFGLVSAFAPRPVGRAHGVLGIDRGTRVRGSCARGGFSRG